MNLGFVTRSHFDQTIAALQAAIVNTINKAKGDIMGSVNQSGANLQAGEAALANDIATLGTTLSAEIADAQAAIAAALAAAGVPQSVVDGVTAQLASLDTTVQGLTTQAKAGDPGPQPTPPAPAPNPAP